MTGRRGRLRAWRTSSAQNPSVWHCETYVTGDTGDTVGRENIEGIIISEGKLELGRKVANGAGHETEENCSGCTGEQGYKRSLIVVSLRVTYESQQNQKLG